MGGPWNISHGSPEMEDLVSWDLRTHCRALPSFFSINRRLMPCHALFSECIHFRCWPVASRAHSSLQARMSNSWQNKSSPQAFLTHCALLLFFCICLCHTVAASDTLGLSLFSKLSHALAVKFSLPGMPFPAPLPLLYLLSSYSFFKTILNATSSRKPS